MSATKGAFAPCDCNPCTCPAARQIAVWCNSGGPDSPATMGDAIAACIAYCNAFDFTTIPWNSWFGVSIDGSSCSGFIGGCGLHTGGLISGSGVTDNLLTQWQVQGFEGGGYNTFATLAQINYSGSLYSCQSFFSGCTSDSSSSSGPTAYTCGTYEIIPFNPVAALPEDLCGQAVEAQIFLQTTPC